MYKFQITPHLKLNGYEFQREIGRGQFAVVWEALHLFTNNQVAIKCFSLNQEVMKNDRITILKEIYFNQKFFHPFICQYFDFFEVNSIFFIVFENCSENLVTFSNKRSFLDEKTAHKLFYELFYALESLHNDYNIIHRDLKVENILIDLNKNAFLSDFGLSISIEPPLLHSSIDNVNINSNHLKKQQVGSIYYMSPEMVKNEEYDKSIDIWSLGIVLFAITNGKLPFDGNSVDSIKQKILFSQPQFQPHFNSFSPNLKSLIIRMLDKNKKSRITMEEIKMNCWFTERKYKKIEDFEKISFDLTRYQIDYQIINKIFPSSNKCDMIVQKLQNEINYFQQIKHQKFEIKESSGISSNQKEMTSKKDKLNGNCDIYKEHHSDENNNTIERNVNNFDIGKNVINEAKLLNSTNDFEYEKYGIKIRSMEFVSYLIEMRKKLKLQMKIEEKDIIINKQSIVTSPRGGKKQIPQLSKTTTLSQSIKPSVKKPIIPAKRQALTSKSKKQSLSLSMKSSEVKKKKV